MYFSYYLYQLNGISSKDCLVIGKKWKKIARKVTIKSVSSTTNKFLCRFSFISTKSLI